MTAKPKVMENYKRSWKKVMKFEELKEYEPCVTSKKIIIVTYFLL